MERPLIQICFVRNVVFALAAALAAILASLMAAPAFAHGTGHEEPSFAPACHAASGPDRTLAQMARAIGQTGPAAARGWDCSIENWQAYKPAAWLLFKREAWEGEERPRYFFSRISRFNTITFAAIDADGTIRTRKWAEKDAEPFASGPVFQLELPEIRAETRALIVRIERPHSVPLLTEARLTFYPEDADWSLLEVLLLAFVAGMLVLPLFFDISFYIVLRERFVLLHAAMVLAMMGYVLFSGGLISVFATFSLATTAIIGPLAWAIGVGASALFLASFLEKGAQSPLMRTITIWAGYWSICVPGFFALQFHSTQWIDDRGYFYAFVPVILIFTAALIEAVLRGSRSAKFIAVAWAPIILASVDRLLRGLGVYVGPSVLDLGMYVASGLEVMVVSLAIADRFLALRRERDAALTEAEMLEHLSTRDPLTGLFNRRGLEARFSQLFDEGFDTFALVDLDRFKQVNDQYGHQVGDAALIACAEALSGNGDPDLVAARLGGEEFVVLLRGKHTMIRAEALRNAIPLRIAAQIEGLNEPVTASCGVIEVPRAGSAMLNFDQFYARADRLMYDAKESGRNRMVSEKLTVFPGGAGDERHAQKTAQLPRRPERQRRGNKSEAA